MSLKRKALTHGGRDSKRSTPVPSTPQSIDSDDEYTDDNYASASEEEHIRKNMQKSNFSAFNNKAAVKSKSSVFGTKDFSWLALKPDHDNRPLWINPGVAAGSRKGPKIILESFSPLAHQAEDFLITIAEPQSRPQFLHEYRLTEHSLYAALSVGLSGDDIIKTLEKLSKTPVADSVKEFINKHTKSYGRVRLVLRENKFFLESEDPEIIQMLLRDEIVGPCRIADTQATKGTQKMGGLIIPGTRDAAGARQNPDQAPQMQGTEGRDPEKQAEEDMLAALRDEDDDEEENLVETHSFQIATDTRDKVAERCLDIGFPALSEYDFMNDHVNVTLQIDLKPNTQIRSYQEKALGKMFGNGRAKSGIIVLPCGAGKTLVGITAGCTIRKSIIVLCTSSMSVVQWRNEFLKWSDIDESDIAAFTSENKDKFRGDAGIIVSTYSMISQTRARAHDSQQVMDWITSREWGLMILDEVHVVPAKIFRRIGERVRSHSKLGLTATLLREDDKITDLNYIIGPKLFEANWMELASQGHIARVQCAEVWCPMTIEFYKEYQKESSKKKALYYYMNPTKFQVCQFLIDYHEKRGDKTIVFSDNVYTLEQYARKLNKAYIYGGTPQSERLRILANFQHNEQVNTVFLSKIGDTSLDLPEATCLIQISSHYGSRRQEAQRLGRILRAKRRNDEGFNAFFYSLVSKDTMEMYYSAKRQAFLVDQGYAFKVITQLQGIENLPNLAFRTQHERVELLTQVMLQNEAAVDVENVQDDLFSEMPATARLSAQRKKAMVKRQAAQLSDLAGGEGMAYIEYQQSKNKELKKKKGPESDFFKKQQRDAERRRKQREKEMREMCGE
ncbi:putative dna repair helicase rad25 [Phaeomoniella chlamydospora]|uniref:DNA 3'-5' helicase n=1 Tax=Phaeomoniella chlamydospora TaxID=158046 RepID=A0A0G2FVL3_PHACM|nr:putative dna repair helicase rad25 [Phaeomoniella chlamydospora]